MIVWGTGFVGKAALKSLLGHPEFEIAGVVVDEPAKDGLNLPVIAGRGVLHEDGMRRGA